MNSHFHFLIIVETVVSQVMPQWPKHIRTTWGMVRTIGRMVLHSHVPDGLGHPLQSWMSSQPLWNSEHHFSQMLYLSYAINIHLYQLVVNFDGRGKYVLPTVTSCKTTLTEHSPYISFQAEIIQSIPATFPGEIQRNFWWPWSETVRDVKTSQIQAGSKHNVPLDDLNTFTELVLQVCVANVLRSLTQLSQYLFQSSHAADDAACTENNSFWIQVASMEGGGLRGELPHWGPWKIC